MSKRYRVVMDGSYGDEIVIKKFKKKKKAKACVKEWNKNTGMHTYYCAKKIKF